MLKYENLYWPKIPLSCFVSIKCSVLMWVLMTGIWKSMVKLHQLRYDNRHHHIFPNEWKILVPLSNLSEMVSTCLHQFISIEFNDPFKVRIIAVWNSQACTWLSSSLLHALSLPLHHLPFDNGNPIRNFIVRPLSYIHFHKVIAVIFFCSPSPGATSHSKNPSWW